MRMVNCWTAQHIRGRPSATCRVLPACHAHILHAPFALLAELHCRPACRCLLPAAATIERVERASGVACLSALANCHLQNEWDMSSTDSVFQPVESFGWDNSSVSE